MNNKDTCVPFERAFKRLRVREDGDFTSQLDDSSENQQKKHRTPTKTVVEQQSNTCSQLSTNNCIRKTKTNAASNELKSNEDDRLSDSNAKDTNHKPSELAQNCSNQARSEPDVTVDELAGYFDLQLFLPKKMSFMAELMYT